jgi:hypothetical protein
MSPETFRKLQLHFGKAAFALKSDRRMTSADMGQALRDFDEKLMRGTVTTEAQANAEIAALRAKYAPNAKRGGKHDPLAEAKARVSKRIAQMRRAR